MRKFTAIFVACFGLLLSSCQSTHSLDTLWNRINGSVAPPTNILGENLPEPVEYYLDQADRQSTPDREAYLLLATQRLLQDGNTVEARALLSRIDVVKLPPKLIAQKHLVQARLELLLHTPRAAQKSLDTTPDPTVFNTNTRAEYYRLRAATAIRTGRTLSGIKHYIQAAALTSDRSARLNTQRTIWHLAQKLSVKTLVRAEKATAHDAVLQGWMSLALIAKNKQGAELRAAINEWRNHFPEHPANTLLPENIDENQSPFSKANNRVILLLPLHGPLKSAGEAVRNGFMTAYFRQQLDGNQSIDVIDTSQDKDIVELYQQAVSQGAQFIVGPLRREKVDRLIRQASISVPTLALNYSRLPVDHHSQLFQFGLSPLDETEQVAEYASAAGANRMIMLTPKNDWGQELAETFSQRWQQQGGQVVDHFAYFPGKKLSANIKHLLEVDTSLARKTRIDHILGKKTDGVPRRRQDIDAFFLVATPRMAQQIRPLLKFYYAGDVPVYATSSIYSGQRRARGNHDLDGIMFCDIPWILDQSSSAKKAREDLIKLWPRNAERNIRLYAVGLDAFMLVQQPDRLVQLPQFPLQGATGKLTLDNQQRIHRRLNWAKMHNGLPVPLTAQ